MSTISTAVIKKYDKLVADGLIDLMFDFEIIGYTALNIGGVKVVDQPDNPAVGYTDYKAIYVNAPYCEKYNLDKEHIKFLIAHEVFHLITLTRSRQNGRDPQLWNVASDYAINQLLIEDEETASNLKCKKAVGTFIEHGCYEKKYKNMSAEEIYEDLIKEMKNQKSPGQGTPQSGQQGSDQSQPSQDQQNDEGQSSGQGQFDREEQRDKEGKINLDVHLDTEDPKIQEDIHEAIIRVEQILEQSQSQGKLSQGMRRFLDKLPKPKYPWRKELDKHLKSFLKAESTWKKPNKRFYCGGDPVKGGVYMPTRYNTPKLNVAVGIDTSGSINDKVLAEFWGHVYKILGSYKHYDIQVFCWSTVAHKNTYRKLDEKTIKTFNPCDKNYIESNGGTTGRSGFDYVKTFKNKPDIFINFTDGYFENHIDFDHCPTIFAIRKEDNRSFKVPTGMKKARVVFIED